MANKKIKHIVAKLLGESTEETLDIYDESALHATDIVDNLTSTDATKVLSAKQGKALNDSIGTLSSTITSTKNSLDKIIGFLYPVTDLNDATTTGVYKYDGYTSHRPDNFGVCAVFSTNTTATGNMWYFQVAFATTANNKIYYRQKVNTAAWTNWASWTAA